MSTAERAARPVLFLRLLDWEPARYLAASIVALVGDVATFSVSMRALQLSWSAAATLGFLLGALIAYTLSVRWVFAHRSQSEHPVREASTFVLIGAMGLLLTQAALWVCIDKLRLHAEASRLAAAGITFCFNYFTRALMLFRARTNASGQT